MEKNKTEDMHRRYPNKERRMVEKLLDCLQSGTAPAWLSAEHYLICGMCRAAISDMKHMKPLPYTQNTRGHWVPYAFAVSETVDVHADTEMMVEALAHFSPDEAFLRTFPTMRAVSALCRIAKHRNSPDAPNAFALWIDQLRRAKSMDWNAVHDRLSAVEKTLMSDPCGAYPICDEETKAAYRDAVHRMAVKQRITEEAAAERVLSCASVSEGRKSEISYHLFPPQKHNTGIGWYLLFFGAAFLFSLLTVILLRPYGVLSSIAVGCALLLPYYALIREAVNILSVRWLRAGYVPVLRLQADAAVIASKARSLTVITSLLRGGEHDLELCQNLERFYLRNRGDGLYFGVLCDLPPSEKELTEEDTAHITAVRERIAHLNALYGEHFCLFVRRRIYSGGEGCYMGWERKRGAVLELSGYLRGRNAESFLYSSCPKEIGRITYVCTLDEDTQLPPEAIHTMLGAMMHPHNRPDIRDGAVRAGCAMLQPSMAVTLEGASATRFTLLCTGRGGMDPYSRYHMDGESLLFGEGSFCGKGIFDVDAFLAVLDGAFPDHTVLSHDFLEGARLGCRNIPAVTFSDTIPTTPGAYFARQGRWVRGDVQALRFAFPHHKNARGETVVNPVSPAARLRIIDHVLHALTPPAILRAVLIIAFLPLPTVICAVLWLLLFSSYLLRPIGLCLRTWAWRALFRQFFGTVYTDLRQALYWLFFRIVFAAEEGWVNTRAIVTALYRMLVSGHHLLAWVTAGEREAGSKKSSCRASYRAMRISVIIGAVLVILSPHPTAKVLGLLWICAPWLAHAVSHAPKTRYTHRFSAEISKKKPEGKRSLEEYRALAAPIWQFFADHVGEETNHLPPDNLQWFPLTEQKTAHRTSPTNIGLYFCACIAACRFGFLTPAELRQRLDAALLTLIKLRHYRGHFYNWYDIQTCEVIGVPYLSTVDSGNLACALLCASGGAMMFAKEDIGLLETAKELRSLAFRMDFSFLFDKRSKQLSLGYHTENDAVSEGKYDLYCSEARSAVYFAIAAGQIPADAWTHLSRPMTEDRRMIGIRSWTGSAFEYFMPALWLPVPENSMDAQLLGYAVSRQADDCTVLMGEVGPAPVFGKSEGAYYAFDAAGNFQYQPYGVPSLALCDGMEKQSLCMPYALYLMLPFAPTTVYPVLDHLKTLGMMGPYGLYEALDHTRERVGGGYAAVRSYMAHHMGMSLTAIANAAFDGFFQKAFFADRSMEAYGILLNEKIPTDAVTCPYLHREIPEKLSAAASEDMWTEDPGVDEEAPVYALLSNTASYIAADSMGGMTLYHGSLALTPTDWRLSALAPTVFCRDVAVGRVYTPCRRSADRTQNAQFSFAEQAHALSWTAVYADGTRCSMTCDIASSGIGYRLEISLTRHGIAVPFELTFGFRPVIYASYAYAVHRTFADLFLSVSRDADSSSDCFRIVRRPRSSDEMPTVMTVSCGGVTDAHAGWDASDNLPLGYTDADVLTLGDQESLKLTIGEEAASAVVPFLIIRGSAVRGCAAAVITLGEKTAEFDAALITRVRREQRLLCGGQYDGKTVGTMLAAMFGKPPMRLIRSEVGLRPKNAMYGKERFWKYGISGDRAYFAVLCGEDASSKVLVSGVLTAWKYLLLCGVRCDLVFCVREIDAYGAPCSRLVIGEIQSQGLSFFVGCGLFLCETDAAARDGLILSACHVFGEYGQTAPTAARSVRIAAVSAPQTSVRYTAEDRHIVVVKGKMRMPWTFLLSNGVIGTLLTTNSLGFTFFENARECRVTPWFGDPVSERSGEYLLLRASGTDVYHDLCREAQSCVITPTAVHYLGLIGALSFRITVTVPDRTRHKRIELYIKNESTDLHSLRVRYQLQPLFGVVPEDREVISFCKKDRELHFRTETNAACAKYSAHVSLVGCEDISSGAAGEDMLYIGGGLNIPSGSEVHASIHLRIVRNGERAVAPERLVPSRTWAKPRISSGDSGLDALAAIWLPWQIVGVRMWGRCGYYQPGGAYGFRDQLQDAMAAACFAPELLYAQIFRAASHQYREGDVQHWWHPEPLSDRAKSHRGIRSRCSDDLLWLVAASARYARLTEDMSFLERQVRYLESPPLTDEEDERYETPLRSEVRESLYMHCVRAVEFTLERGFGVHGMPYIGIGDWNDGMNRVGVRGQGESVWCGMFLLLVLSEFLPLCKHMGDEEGYERYADCMRRLAIAIESEAWNGQWYRRAWYDDGTPMGDPGDAEAEIDLLPQAFAAIVNHCVRLPGGGKPFDEDRVHRAVLASYERLFDAEHGMYALLSPPFGTSGDPDAPDPGYIAAYPPGARENGGQYTHAAVWGAMGLFAVGETERGMKVVRALSPFFQTRDEAAIIRYQREPWALCGDILRTPGRMGEGGWSLYTGSAGWYYRLLLALFGDGWGW